MILATMRDSKLKVVLPILEMTSVTLAFDFEMCLLFVNMDIWPEPRRLTYGSPARTVPHEAHAQSQIHRTGDVRTDRRTRSTLCTCLFRRLLGHHVEGVSTLNPYVAGTCLCFVFLWYYCI